MKKIVIVIFLLYSVVLFSQYYRQAPGTMTQSIPIEVTVTISKDVGVPNNLYKDDLYALVTVKVRGISIPNARVLVGRAGLTYSEFNQRYEGRIWDGGLGTSIEVAIKLNTDQVIRGSIIKDYEVQLLAPAADSSLPGETPIDVSWNFKGKGAPAELNLFRKSDYKHLYQFKQIMKKGTVIPKKEFKSGESYLIQVRGKTTYGEFIKTDFELSGNSTIQYSASHAVIVKID